MRLTVGGRRSSVISSGAEKSKASVVMNLLAQRLACQRRGRAAMSAGLGFFDSAALRSE